MIKVGDIRKHNNYGGPVTILLAGHGGGDPDPVHVLDLTREGPGHQLVLFD